MSKIPNQTTPRFDDLLEGLTGRRRILLYLQLWFITLKRHKAKSAKGKTKQNKKTERSRFWKKPCSNFQKFSPGRVTQDRFNCSCNKLWQHIWNVIYQGSLTEPRSSQFLLGADHVINLCVTCTKIPDPRKKARLQHKPYCLYKYLSTMNYYSY